MGRLLPKALKKRVRTRAEMLRGGGDSCLFIPLSLSFCWVHGGWLSCCFHCNCNFCFPIWFVSLNTRRLFFVLDTRAGIGILHLTLGTCLCEKTPFPMTGPGNTR